MRAVIFSGTTEGRMLSSALAQRGFQVTVCVATEYGQESQGKAHGIAVQTGRQDVAEMARTVQGAAVCVDATHPYAEEATVNICGACAAAGVPYVRLLRRESNVWDGAQVQNAAEAAAYLANTIGGILLATGVKELPAFAGLSPQRLFPRVLPTQEGILGCEALGVPHRNIIAMQGPFSKELNCALIRQFAIQYMVTKDGGAAGGFAEKVEAAKETGAKLVVIRRPRDEGLPYEAVLKKCEEMAVCR